MMMLGSVLKFLAIVTSVVGITESSLFLPLVSREWKNGRMVLVVVVVVVIIVPHSPIPY